MIHSVCYLRGGESGREGRQLWSSAWPLCTALGSTRPPCRLSVWSSFFSFHSSSLCSLRSLLLPQHLPSRSHPPPPPPPLCRLPSQSSALNFSSEATCCLPEPEKRRHQRLQQRTWLLTPQAQWRQKKNVTAGRQCSSWCEISSSSFMPSFNKRQNCPPELIASNCHNCVLCCFFVFFFIPF